MRVIVNETETLNAAIERLERLAGNDESLKAFARCLSTFSAEQKHSAHDLLRIAECLMQAGDVSMLIGRDLRGKALKMLNAKSS